MAHESCMAFVRASLTASDVADRSLIEVGSADVNGSARDYLESLQPAQYVGVDIALGPGVDVICDARKLVDRFGPESFDIVVSTEMLEHVRDWRSTVANMKSILRPGGIVILTTRSFGFPWHGYPFDFWRFEVTDMEQIFADFESVELRSDPDPESPGVFVKAVKPMHTHTDPVDLSQLRLYNINLHRRTKTITRMQFAVLQLGWTTWRRSRGLLPMSLRMRVSRFARRGPPPTGKAQSGLR